jgi:hypothetical protein
MESNVIPLEFGIRRGEEVYDEENRITIFYCDDDESISLRQLHFTTGGIQDFFDIEVEFKDDEWLALRAALKLKASNLQDMGNPIYIRKTPDILCVINRMRYSVPMVHIITDHEDKKKDQESIDTEKFVRIRDVPFFINTVYNLLNKYFDYDDVDLYDDTEV